MIKTKSSLKELYKQLIEFTKTYKDQPFTRLWFGNYLKNWRYLIC